MSFHSVVKKAAEMLELHLPTVDVKTNVLIRFPSSHTNIRTPVALQLVLAGPGCDSLGEAHLSISDECDGPLLSQADPPYPEDENCTATSDPEAQCVTTNPLAHPGADGQEKPICAITRGQKEEELDETGRTGERRTRSGNNGEDEEDNEGNRGNSNTDGPAETHTEDWTSRTSRKGGAQRKLWQRLGKSGPLQVHG
ncbi:hypothetical protein NDU88_003463 [Pleurodeles waltl]|uniref:Uncharacterized protein n=1 Tax=Pleurodeles waltl TaxID=8319 RepID=A0AAV7QD23_PLEWA|nr:hypothetical protein NDU88_003463 [Pleurodeles waltl]